MPAKLNSYPLSQSSLFVLSQRSQQLPTSAMCCLGGVVMAQKSETSAKITNLYHLYIFGIIRVGDRINVSV